MFQPGRPGRSVPWQGAGRRRGGGHGDSVTELPAELRAEVTRALRGLESTSVSVQNRIRPSQHPINACRRVDGRSLKRYRSARRGFCPQPPPRLRRGRDVERGRLGRGDEAGGGALTLRDGEGLGRGCREGLGKGGKQGHDGVRMRRAGSAASHHAMTPLGLQAWHRQCWPAPGAGRSGCAPGGGWRQAAPAGMNCGRVRRTDAAGAPADPVQGPWGEGSPGPRPAASSARSSAPASMCLCSLKLQPQPPLKSGVRLGW